MKVSCEAAAFAEGMFGEVSSSGCQAKACCASCEAATVADGVKVSCEAAAVGEGVKVSCEAAAVGEGVLGELSSSD
jgi:hypothetical protein